MMATIGQQLLQPESGWQRYDDTHSFIKYSGDWTSVNSPNFYKNTVTHNKNIGGNATFSFKGTKVRIIGAKNGISPSIGSSNVTVKIDGIEEVVSFYNPTVLYQIIIYEKVDLEDKIHRIELINNENNYIWLDAIDIDIDGDLVRYDYFELNYPEPMRKYGVAWFDFDELSGSVYDKLGNNYVGTVSGATRVDGWNGEGYAIAFNGSSQIITMNNPIIPVGEKTIRFKVKIPSYKTTARLLSNATAITGVGLSIQIVDGKILCVIRGANAKSIETPMKIETNAFQDIMITFSGSTETDSISFYINEGLVFKSLIGTVEKQGTNNLFIGTDAFYNNVNEYFQGELDDLQIYNKALIPSDFTQKRLAIKSESNKNLVLSPTSTRVKEIPNTEENTLLAQGGVIREIDSAIDRPPIDLTRTSTEYEIVTNNKSPLNNGKIFTIPIDNNFKTAFIEDNY
ncbi:LamG-like jellyroll fold domain-containing protein [Lysinibacillus sp. FSL H8-0500]|uniref:LamG-like jellyroll fold domain-containing protein n=1 Tax=Lysinibacillus sp. FSL H8-0500 TaxID=2921393 RepID=UPI003100EE38